ncbi:phosphorylase [Waterburya agarophytonicola K14]|uniref:Phosphorylase n=1 Tax=Waterburya agarophytonicola KI4 TaxID=2874699 RepID=A0A964BQN8_9CYAN|nr:phosphorylase [Waterburya agarophytonicola KI4]
MPIDTIVVPQGAEYQAVCRGLKKANCDRLKVLPIPIGTKKIEQTLADYSWELIKAQNILIMGLCGSLSPKYSVGDLVLYQSCCNLDGAEINLHKELTTKIQQRRSIDLVTGLTSDRLICRAREKLQLSKTYLASVLDMEGYDYMKKFQQRNINVAMLRVVSDDLTGDIPDLSQAIDEEGNLKTLSMAIAFFKQPLAATRLIKGSLKGLKILEQITYQLVE